MAKVLIVFSTSLLSDLSERPGRSKLDKEKAAIPRIALQKILERLSRDMQKAGGTGHMRADLFQEPISTLRLYTPDSLAVLLSNFRALTPVPKKSRYAVSQPNGYLAVFDYPRLAWSLLSAYLEVGDQPVLVFLRAAPDLHLQTIHARIAARLSDFDQAFAMAEQAAADALDNRPSSP